jgi:LPXTG-motif cell wall-anchored protein
MTVRRVLLLWLFPFAACGAERVLDFHSEIRIARDGTLTVTEMITVQAEGRQIRRGILRDFPAGYRDRRGDRVRAPFEVLSVARNGQAEPYVIERRSDGKRIRTGAADVLLPFGAHEYRITYRTARRIGFFEGHDELYWDVNGHGWGFAFERMSAEARFADPVPAGGIEAQAYTGPQGSRARDYQAFVREGSAAFRITRPLGPREGMTLVVAFPKGVVAPPDGAERFDAWIESNPWALAGLGAVLVLGIYLIFRRRRRTTCSNQAARSCTSAIGHAEASER